MGDGHDDHWAALLGHSEDFTAFVDRVAKTGQLVERQRPRPADFRGATLITPQRSEHDSSFTVRSSGTRDLQGLVILGSNEEVLAAYPFGATGKINEVEVHEIDPWPAGVEACLSATFHGECVDFFDTLYYKYKDKYTLPTTRPFVFSAVALSILVCDEFEMVGMGLSPDATILVPVSKVETEFEAKPDRYVFQSTVREAEAIRFAETPVHKLVVTLFNVNRPKTGSQDFDAVLYASCHVLPEGYTPVPGDILQGVLWLTGYLDFG